MVADNCRLSCQLDTLVLLTNRSAKLIRKCCKSGNYGYHFSLCVILAANAVKTKRLRISEPSFYHFIFLKNLYNKSILFEQRIGIASKRVSSSHSHHFISCNFWMSSSLNLFFINLAGFPPTIE